MFDQDFLDSIEDDPVLGILTAIQRHDRVAEDCAQSPDFLDAEIDAALQTYALILSIADAYNLYLGANEIETDLSIVETTKAIRSFLAEVQSQFAGHTSKKKLAALRRQFESSLGKQFAYEFSQGDLEQIQALINELRVQITSSTFFEEGHKNRLLKRLERLQSELHKRVPDVDRFWGLIGDAGVALGKFGNDAKPIVDRIKEIADIVWRTQSRAEELPTNTPSPLIGHDTKTEA